MNPNTELPEPKIGKPKIYETIDKKLGKKNLKKFKYLDDIIDKDFQKEYFKWIKLK